MPNSMSKNAMATKDAADQSFTTGAGVGHNVSGYAGIKNKRNSDLKASGSKTTSTSFINKPSAASSFYNPAKSGHVTPQKFKEPPSFINFTESAMLISGKQVT